MARFLHTADLHLGKRFGAAPEALSGALTAARMGALERLAGAARAHGAGVVLVAGDVFDAETPPPQVIRQALQIMAEAADLRWVLLPGNHDPLAADELWSRARAEAPANVTLALTPEPVTPGGTLEGAVLLPAPCPRRRPGRDTTEGFDAAPTPPGAARIGLAHGAVADFGEEAGSAAIAPDRARRAGLAYLALGDWHGQTRIDARTWYAGTPEPDRHRHGQPGRALVVSIEGPDAPPQVSPVETGRYFWAERALRLTADEDPAAALAAALPPTPDRRRTLLRLAVEGRARLPARAALLAALEAVAPDFALFEPDFTGLCVAQDAADLDAIDRAGALRDAAETLLAEARDAGRPVRERAAAEAALSILYGYMADAP
ncbi:metallophosphoesterase family protein [Rubrimonas cliftonensis]|uniref:DNA repair exonuclease SbcCD nuclease subunit n=1 Tax=Rubrimonas cliftonensis TaxID=89524 RepID=A0A1H4CHS0_9RHOB|nr:DNA repair exonuclease [Rubrimonas cliftonensis]SEA59873.1 DNA repair exonuclease SbcCD nuclease subunit [Rubrimonas cliftonensis]